jgi:hypothetical protein
MGFICFSIVRDAIKGRCSTTPGEKRLLLQLVEAERQNDTKEVAELKKRLVGWDDLRIRVWKCNNKQLFENDNLHTD